MSDAPERQYSTDVSYIGSAGDYGQAYEVRCICGALVDVSSGGRGTKCYNCDREWHLEIRAYTDDGGQ